MPNRGIKKRLLNKVSALFSIRRTKQRIEIHGEHNQLDCNSPKQSDIKTMSSLAPQTKHRGIRFSRRAVQRSKYLRQKFGVRKTVMGFSPRFGSITEEDESEITLWMLAENAENVISKGISWLRNSDDCCEDSTDMEQEDHEKILQMWIESNSFDNFYDNDEDVKDIDDGRSSSFSEDDDYDDDQDSEVTDDDDDDNNDDKNQHPIPNDYDRNSNEGIDDNVDVMQNNNVSNSYPMYDSGTESDDEEEDDDDDDTVHDNEVTHDNVIEKSCSIYVDDESFDELDDDDDTVHHDENTADNLIEKSYSIYVDEESFDELHDNDDGDDEDDGRDDSHQHSAQDNFEFVAEIIENEDTILNIPKIDCCGFSDTSSNRGKKENVTSDIYPSTIKREHVRVMDKMKADNLTKKPFPKLDSCSSKDFKSDDFGNNNHGNIVTKYKETDDNESISFSGSGDVVDGDDSTDDDADDDHKLDINHNDNSCCAHLKYLSKDNANTNTVNTLVDSDIKVFDEQVCLPEKIEDGEKRKTECQDHKEEQTTPDDAMIGSVKDEITEILSRISQIENDFNYMRKSMNVFRS